MTEIVKTVFVVCIVGVLLRDILVEGDYSGNKFRLFRFCDGVNYGNVLSNQSHVVSLVECGSVCSLESACLSFVFNDVTGICVTNAHTYDPTSLTGCSFSLMFGAKQGVDLCMPGESCTLPVADLRLCEGNGAGQCNATKGRVEIYVNGRWGTVCDDLWNDDDYSFTSDIAEKNAQVVCNALGYSSALERPSGYFRAGSGTQWLDNVNCTGNEASLLDCPHKPLGQSNCLHSEDVGVECW